MAKFYPFKLIDTAGIKAATKLASPVEYFSRLRSLDAIKQTDVVFLVLDAVDGVTHAGQGDRWRDRSRKSKPDRHRGQQVGPRPKKAFAAKKQPEFAESSGISDFKTEREYRLKYERGRVRAPVLHARRARLSWCLPSAMSGYEVDRMLNAAVQAQPHARYQAADREAERPVDPLPRRSAPRPRQSRASVFACTTRPRPATRPFRIKLFCNREEKLTEQYRRYLEAGLVDEFKINGCPVYFDLVGKKRRDAGERIAAQAASARTRRKPTDTPATDDRGDVIEPEDFGTLED